MSAICGIIQQNGAPIAAERCAAMAAALEPYGRDATGQWSESHAALASRLFRLLPEDEHDRQPLIGGGGRFVLTADLRLDNREQLGHSLGIQPSRLLEMADADFLLAAYEKWEHATPNYLVGEFAFAVWDRSKQTLFLARDHMGRRPLFYHQGSGWFGFATMPAGLLALPDVPKAPDEERIRDLLLVLSDHSNHSYFAGICRLFPGHAAALSSDGAFRSWRYWTPPTAERLHFKADEDYVDAFLEIIEEAVRCRLRSVGGVATQLSAGFDSATITSVAARLLGSAGRTLDAFTAVPNPAQLPPFKSRVLDEGDLAAKVAELFPNIRHHRLRTDDESIFDVLEVMLRVYNRPAKNLINLIWDMAIARNAAAMGATTLLTGELGNFTISYHGEHVLNALLREGRLRCLLPELSLQMRGATIRGKLGALRRMIEPSLPDRLQELLELLLDYFEGDRPIDLGINPQIMTPAQLQRYCREQGRHANTRLKADESRAWRQRALLRHDFAEYGKGTLALAGVDRRDPTVDIRLIQYCQAIPVEQFFKNGSNRWLLRRALRRYWPGEIIASRAKGKQGADWRYRVDREMSAIREEIEQLKSSPLAGHLLDMDAMERLSDTSTFGARGADSQSFLLLRLIGAGHFLRHAAELT